MCHVTIPTVIKWIESGELEGFKIPGSKNRRITRESLLNFMRKFAIPTTELEKGKPRILVVDDDINVLELLKSLFTEDKFELRLVSCGFEAGLAKEFKPDLILLDIMLPDIDGCQVCEYIRGIPEISSVKIMAMSAYLNTDVEELLQRGFDDYIAKPLERQLFMDKVDHLLNKTARKKKK